MTIDLKLDPVTHDLLLTDYDLVLTDGKEQVIQNLKIRLLFFIGEWFLDITRGIPYYEEVFIKNANQSRIETILRQQILETENVNQITSFVMDYDSFTRLLTVKFSVDTNFGPIEMSEELPT